MKSAARPREEIHVMPTPSHEGALRQLALRIPDEVVTRLDRHVERLRRASPGASFSRSDAIRMLLISALDTAERTASK